MADLLTLENVTFGYPGRPKLFENLHFTLRDGEAIGLLGPNGSGKTSLLRLVMGLERPEEGLILLHGKRVESADEWRTLRCTIGLVLQNSDEQLFSSTVLEDVAFGPLNLGLSRFDARQRAMEALQCVGMEDFAHRPIHELSGGEKKLIALASVLSMRPKSLLLDEPTTFLDEAAKRRIANLLPELGATRIVISHDSDFLAKTTGHIVTIEDGQIRPLRS